MPAERVEDIVGGIEDAGQIAAGDSWAVQRTGAEDTPAEAVEALR